MTNKIAFICHFQLVSKTDDEKPVFINVPENLVINTDRGLPTAVVSWQQPSARDNSFGSVTITSNFNPGDRFPIGKTNITYTATDMSGNEQSAMFSITVIGEIH